VSPCICICGLLPAVALANWVKRLLSLCRVFENRQPTSWPEPPWWPVCDATGSYPLQTHETSWLPNRRGSGTGRERRRDSGTAAEDYKDLLLKKYLITNPKLESIIKQKNIHIAI